jgi:DNA processing protein
MSITNPFSHHEINQLTKGFQTESESDSLELLHRIAFSMISEPGDRLLQKLTEVLGTNLVLGLLVEGFDLQEVTKRLNEQKKVAELEFLFGDHFESLRAAKERWLPRVSKRGLVNIIDQCLYSGYRILGYGSVGWPAGLASLGLAAPHVLYVQGESENLAELSNGISIVGARAATDYGKKVTRKIVQEVYKRGLSTVSGGAIGIDYECHAHSLKLSVRTVAVMAGGLNRMYPKQNFQLFSAVVNHGALISELPPDSAPTRWRFLQRNRLIAALTSATVVVEAAQRSGSIRTANDALEISRPLFAVPGSILSGASDGTNQLIAEGKAIALTKPSEIFGFEIEQQLIEESDNAKRVRDALREAGVADDLVIRRLSGLTHSEYSAGLLEGLSSGDIIAVQGNSGSVYYCLKYA